MLKKECCQKCWNKIENIGWHKEDEKEWNNGVVWCPLKHKNGLWEKIKTTDEPPINCPFILEQVI